MPKNKKNKKMIYTPEHHIPVGEAIVAPNGEIALQVKKAKSDEYDYILIGSLVSQVASFAEKTM